MLVLACASMMTSAMAQLSLVKEVDKMAGGNNLQQLTTAFEKIQPALTDAESANDAFTWFTAGKLALKLYDQMQAAKLTNQTVDDELMGKALLSGFDYLQKALPLDSVKETNKDGSLKLDKTGLPKVKTKYSKDILPLLSTHMNDVGKLADEHLNVNNFEKAAEAYTYYLNLLESPLAKAQYNVDDQLLAPILFCIGYSQYQTKDFANAYNNLTAAADKGYTENQIDAFKTSALANIVQAKLDAKDYDAANKFIDDALVVTPNSAILYDMKGFTAELEKDDADAALPFYKKAAELDENYAQGFFDTGRCLYLKADKIIEKNPDLKTSELAKMLVPIYKEALPYLQKAIALDENKKGQTQRIIDDINYKMELMDAK